jgi:transcriptional regulator with XRE-family HTH domain
MLGWSQTELAEAARVSRATVVDFERGARIPHRSNLTAIRRALETGGIEFVAENGVLLKRASQAASEDDEEAVRESP